MFALSPREIRSNLFAGFTTSLALVPEAIAFAIVAHVSPLTGLYAAFIMVLITSAFGGRPAMISGAAGSLAVVSVAVVVQHGIEYLFATIVLMGLFQMLFAVAKLGKLIRMVPHPVMLGFVNGLAVVIFLAQFGNFKVTGADGAQHWLDSASLGIMFGLVALTMLIAYLTPRVSKVVPAALVAILAVALLVNLCGIPTKTVGDLGSIKGGLPQFHLPDVAWSWDTLRIVLPYSLVLAAIGLIETLLTFNLVDELTNTRGEPNRESFAQGAANVVTGLFGGMGGCAMIGQTVINLDSGGTRRLSGIVCGLFLLAFILFGSAWIERIPLAALIGVMFVVCQKTFAWSSLRLVGKVPRADVLIGLMVAVLTVLFDLAVAVLAGVVAAALVFAWQHAQQLRVHSSVDARGWTIHALEGSLFFASATSFQGHFTPASDCDDVVLDFQRATLVDHSALEAVAVLAARYRAAGKRLHLRHLSPQCRATLAQAGALVEISVLEAPVSPA